MAEWRKIEVGDTIDIDEEIRLYCTQAWLDVVRKLNETGANVIKCVDKDGKQGFLMCTIDRTKNPTVSFTMNDGTIWLSAVYLPPNSLGAYSTYSPSSKITITDIPSTSIVKDMFYVYKDPQPQSKPIYFNNEQLSDIYFNGVKIEHLYFNGNQIF